MFAWRKKDVHCGVLFVHVAVVALPGATGPTMTSQVPVGWPSPVQLPCTFTNAGSVATKVIVTTTEHAVATHEPHVWLPCTMFTSVSTTVRNCCACWAMFW